MLVRAAPVPDPRRPRPAGAGGHCPRSALRPDPHPHRRTPPPPLSQHRHAGRQLPATARPSCCLLATLITELIDRPGQRRSAALAPSTCTGPVVSGQAPRLHLDPGRLALLLRTAGFDGAVRPRGRRWWHWPSTCPHPCSPTSSASSSVPRPGGQLHSPPATTPTTSPHAPHIRPGDTTCGSGLRPTFCVKAYPLASPVTGPTSPKAEVPHGHRRTDRPPGTPASTTGREAAQVALIGQPQPIRVPERPRRSWLDDPTVVARFEAKTYRRPGGRCWLGSVSSTGHGSFRAASLPGMFSTWHRARARWFAMRTVTERWACGDGSSRRTSTSGSGREPRVAAGHPIPGPGADRRFGVACGRACPFPSARPAGGNIVGCSTALRAQQGPVSVPTSGNGM